MIVLKILLGIVLFFALLLSLHLKVYLALDDTFHLRAGLGPVLLTLAIPLLLELHVITALLGVMDATSVPVLPISRFKLL